MTHPPCLMASLDPAGVFSTPVRSQELSLQIDQIPKAPENRAARLSTSTAARHKQTGRSKRFARFLETLQIAKAVIPQPPPPTCGARAATGPTIRSKSAFPPALPWIGTCCATSSFRRLMLRNRATALAFTLARFPPAGGGP